VKGHRSRRVDGWISLGTIDVICRRFICQEPAETAQLTVTELQILQVLQVFKAGGTFFYMFGYGRFDPYRQDRIGQTGDKLLRRAAFHRIACVAKVQPEKFNDSLILLILSA
jgi:hypothetical protein